MQTDFISIGTSYCIEVKHEVLTNIIKGSYHLQKSNFRKCQKNVVLWIRGRMLIL